MKFNEKWAKLSKNGKLTVGLIGVICVVTIVVGGSAYANNQSQQKKIEDTSQMVTKAISNVQELNNDVTKLLDSNDSNYLVSNVTNEQVSELSERVDEIVTFSDVDSSLKDDVKKYDKEAEAVRVTMDKVEKAFETQTTINSLYKQDKENIAMNGSKVKKDLPIKDDLKKETAEKAKKELFEKGTNIPYNKIINDLVTTAENQVNQIEKAKSEVAKVFKDGKVVSTDKKLYETAKTETDKIKNEKAKKSLFDQLEKVKSDLDKKEKEESEKAKTAEATKQEVSQNVDSVAKADTGQANGSTATNTQQAKTENGLTVDNGYAPTYDGGNQGGSTGGGNQGGSSGGGSQGDGNQGGPQVPEGWIVPPYPIGSAELDNWILDNGYFGYDSAGGYIRPY